MIFAFDKHYISSGVTALMRIVPPLLRDVSCAA